MQLSNRIDIKYLLILALIIILVYLNKDMYVSISFVREELEDIIA